MRLIHLAAALLFATTLAPIALGQHTHLAPNSTWTLNIKESNFGGAPAPRSETFILIQDDDQWGKYTDVLVDAKGKTWKSSWSGAEDGKPHPVKGIPGSTFSSDPLTDVSVNKIPGSIETCHFSVSADKKKFLEKCVTQRSDGKKFDQSLVYDRTQ